MAFFDEYYRAYRDFRKAVSPLPEYKERVGGLRNADPGTDVHNGSVRHCVIDMDWVEEIEKTLPSIDKAIRENRRFIAVEDEVVPIEKSRRITTESVRHLAQHTNLISRVENDTVTPERILNIRREESFAIYENRFLVLLLDTALRFVEKRYSAIRSQTNSTLSHVIMERDFSLEEEVSRFTLDYYTEYNESTKFDVNADVSTMSDFARLQRVRAILSAFAASPMIRGLKGVEPVRPPIAHTNVLQKDPDFHACLVLFVYLEQYTKDGFRIEQTESEGVMEPLLQENVEVAMDMVNFVVRSMSSPETAAELERTYEEENARRAEEAERLERERKAAEEARLVAAVAAERAVQEEKQRVLRENYEQQLAEQKTEYESRIASLTENYEKQLTDQKNQYEGRITELTEDYRRQLTQQKAEYENRIASITEDYEKKLTEQKAEHDKRIADLTESYEQKLAGQKDHYEQHISELTDRYEAQLTEERTAREQQVNVLVGGYEKQLADERGTHSAQLSALRQEHEKTLTDMQSGFDKERSELVSSYTASIEAGKREAQEAVENLMRSHAEEKDTLIREHEDLLLAKEESWDAEKSDLQERLSDEQEQMNALTEKGALLERELKNLTKQLENERRYAQRRAQDHEKEIQRMQGRLERAAQNAEAKLEKQEKRSQKKIRTLQKRLDKALRKCPYAEVMATEDEEDLTTV